MIEKRINEINEEKLQIRTRLEKDNLSIEELNKIKENLENLDAEYRTLNDKQEIAKKIGTGEIQARTINGEGNKNVDKYEEAFANVLTQMRATDRDMMTVEQRATNIVGTPNLGGYVAPAQFISQLQKNLELISPITGIMKQYATSRKSIILPYLTVKPAAEVQAEEGATSVTELRFDEKEIDLKRYSSATKLSIELAQQNAVRLVEELPALFAEATALKLESDIVSALGSEVAATQKVESENAGELTYNDLLNLTFQVPPQYRIETSANACGYLMHPATYKSILSIIDATGKPLVYSDVTEKGTNKLFGYRIILCDKVPVMATGSKAIFFGNFDYLALVNGENLGVTRLDHEIVTKGTYTYCINSFYGYGLLNDKAFAYLEAK